ncbi:hypothetical protein GCM10025877_05030 [Agromyces mangrovi Wang et al. 2018]|nr:hypothetical protein GCM10025877_05030 [Agromyces mangrovi]
MTVRAYPRALRAPLLTPRPAPPAPDRVRKLLQSTIRFRALRTPSPFARATEYAERGNAEGVSALCVLRRPDRARSASSTSVHVTRVGQRQVAHAAVVHA